MHVDKLRRAHRRAAAREGEVGVYHGERALARAGLHLERAARPADHERRPAVLGKDSAVELYVGRYYAARLEVHVRAVLRVAKGRDAPQLAPHLDRRKRKKLERLEYQVRHRVVRRATAEALHRLPVVAADEVLLAHAHLVDVSEPRVGHLLLREEKVGREESALEGEEPVLRLLRRSAQHLRVVHGKGDRRLEQSPEAALERH